VLKYIFTFIVVTLFTISTFAAKITLHDESATVWSQNQIIKGEIDTLISTTGTLYLNGSPITFQISSSDNSFSVPVRIDTGANTIYVEVDSNSTHVYSDTITYTLGYTPLPEPYIFATVSGRNVTLHGQILSNPDSASLTFAWQADTANPAQVIVAPASDSTAAFTIPDNSPKGEYYFNWYVIASGRDTTRARTFVTVDTSGIKPFNIETDHAAWIDSAVIYGVTPYIFVANGKFNDVTTKIPELRKLGINTLWVQPVFKTHDGGQGYDITNYFSLRSDYGTESDFRKLIKTAKSYGMKVILDIPINHSSIYHPYAENASKYGTDSHYYDFYQRKGQNPDAPYSEYYQYYEGFVNYFWNELPNLNYDNPEVQKWITTACEYWIKNYNIDGYRFDAIWGVTARDSSFTQQLRFDLKRIKPSILMLAEDKATRPEVFYHRFDAAYDWTPEYSWVSHWSWQTDYDPNSDPTIFNNSNQDTRSELLHNALTNDGNGYASNAIVFRFLENNDTQRFIAFNGLARTKMAAALEFSIPGIPLIYNGQETGKSEYPYDAYRIYLNNVSIEQSDAYGLFPYYERLAKLRTSLPAMYSKNFSELSVNPNSYVYAYRRWEGNQNVICVMNMGDTKQTAQISIPVDQMNLDSSKTYYLTDILSGEVFSGSEKSLSTVNIPVDSYTTRMFLFADTIMTVTGIKSIAQTNVPAQFKLSQNYPNPFNPTTNITYVIPKSGMVTLKVYDILGRQVAFLVNEQQNAGMHSVSFDASRFASGVYLYRLSYDGNSLIKKMELIK
jgi:cyclomaltodextrinase / maltogenic alpha-amylase / neopullulanase